MKLSSCALRIVMVAAIWIVAGRAFATTFSNSSAITIPGPSSVNGAADVYPSSIAVSGVGSSLQSVTVAINNFSATHAGNVSLALVAPNGAAMGIQGSCGGSASIANVSYIFSDAAAAQLPSLNTAWTAGTYKTTQYTSKESFPSPGPGTTYQSAIPFGTSTLTTVFGNSNPNGNWSLYAIDPTSGDTGAIAGGWSLNITAVPEPASSTLIAAGGWIFASRGTRNRRM